MQKLLRKHVKPLLNPNSHFHTSNLDFITNSLSQLQPQSSDEITMVNDRTVQISHPWPEWVDLIECLLKKGYFKETESSVFSNGQLSGKDANHIRTACLSFARHRIDIIRYLSRKDIRVISECGCPSTDRKVVNSGKRLRAHVKIDEGNVCSVCSLRGNCKRAYAKPREDEGGRTVDVMRILLTHGLDPIANTVENRLSLNKMTKEAVRRLLKEMVEYGSERLEADQPGAASTESRTSPTDHLSEYGNGPTKVPMKLGDWRCPKCNFLNFARNIKCLHCNKLSEEKIMRIREDQEHLPRKKGDWICDKCSFLNFAKNTKCLLCKEKPAKRHLNPGEWECESCNYINFRKNMICLKCDHRRVKVPSTSTTQPQPDAAENQKSSRFVFVTGEYEAGNNAYIGKETNDKMRIMDDEDKVCDPHNDESGFVDFPILGGKSELSEDAEKRESWKLKMLAKNDKEGKAEETAQDLSTIQRRAYFLGCSDDEDDEDIAEWFGKRNIKGIEFKSSLEET